MNTHDPKMKEFANSFAAQHSGKSTGDAEHESSRDDLSEAVIKTAIAQEEQRRTSENRRFYIANLNSKRIRGLKFWLPVVGGLLIVVFIAIMVVTQFISTPLGIAAIDLTDGKVVMDQPTLSGFTASNAEYEIVADRALQDLSDPKKVLLEKIGATLALKDGNVVSLSANTGKYDIDGESLNLGAGVNVHMSSGYTAELEEAHVDMKSGVLSSDRPVFIKATIGEIRADRLEVRDNGDYILFEDRVKMTIDPRKIRPQ